MFFNLTIEIYIPFHLIKNQVNSSKTRGEAREAREEEVHKMLGMEVAGWGGGGRKLESIALCSLGGRVSTLALRE